MRNYLLFRGLTENYYFNPKSHGKFWNNPESLIKKLAQYYNVHMKFNSLDELPENGSLVWVKLPGEKAIVRIYQDDSFGLGDRDFEVIGWANYLGQLTSYPDSHDYKPLSIRRVLDHNIRHSSELSLSLVR